MALLVAMVITKALLPDLKAEADDFTVRGESETSEVEDFRSQHQEDFFYQPQFNFLASNLVAPAVELFEVTQYAEVSVDELIDENDLNAEVIEMPVQTESVDEVIPMEHTSNTGYGMWRTSSATITSKKDWNGGKVPLDRGNTITDNMSKLFPRTP